MPEPLNRAADIFAEPRDLVPVARTESLDMMKAADPEAVVEQGTRIAKALRPIIEKGKLSVKIGQGSHVKAEGWTSMLAMLGILPREVPSEGRWLETGAYNAVVELVNTAGMVVGRASAQCGSEDDKPWNTRAAYARQSMAITRATGKAARMGFSWIMVLSGFSATPAEEMPPSDGPATREAPAYAPEPGSDVPVIAFGKNKGTRLDELNDKQLSWYIHAANENLEDPEKARFHDVERERLVEYEAETARRGMEPPF